MRILNCPAAVRSIMTSSDSHCLRAGRCLNVDYSQNTCLVNIRLDALDVRAFDNKEDLEEDVMPPERSVYHSCCADKGIIVSYKPKCILYKCCEKG